MSRNGFDTLSERYLLEVTGASSLSEIEELQLHNLDLVDEDLDPKVFNRLTNIKEINLSGNKLTCLPEEISLKSLEYLDISRNCLKHIEFLANFPNIKDLDVACNANLTVDDSYKISFLLNHLEFLDGRGVDNKNKIGNNFSLELLNRIKTLWINKFKSGWFLQKNDVDKSNYIKDFGLFCEVNVRFGPNSLKGYRKWRIQQILKELLSSDFEDPHAFFSNYIGLVELKNNVNKNTTDELTKKQKSDSASQMNGCSVKKKVKINNQIEINSSCKLINFQSLVFLQCHSKSEGPNDFNTQLWCSAFQPDPNDFSKTTRVVATCGGSSLCIINCETTKVVARFKQENEEFFTLAWTCVSIGDQSTSILVAAGCLGFLHLIHVNQAVCYGRIKAHSSPVQTIRFLSNSSTYLLSGDRKGNIFLIDIDTPLIPEYKFTWKKLMCFSGVGLAVIRLLVKDDFLFCGTEAGLFFWSHNNLFEIENTSTLKKISSCHQITFPETDENALIDAIDMINDDIIATKCVNQSAIFLWKLSELHSQFKKTKSNKYKFEVSLFCKLEWSPTAHCFINFSICKSYNVLIVGDDLGNLWVYDLSYLVTSQQAAEFSVLQPHKVIPFPSCIQNDNKANKFKQTIFNDIDCTSDLSYVVVATDNNLVGIFQKC